MMSIAINSCRPMSELASVCRVEQSPQGYRIRSIYEESECHYCGYPLLIQDEAYQHREHIYCSRHCAQTDLT